MKIKQILSVMLAVLMFALTSVALVSCETSYEDETFYLAINTDAEKNKTYVLKEIRDKEATDIVIPAEINGIPVVNIEGSAFEGCTKLKKITFSENIEYIGHAKNKAFIACTALEEIVFNCKNFKGDELQINEGSENGVTLTVGKDSSFKSEIFIGSTNLTKVIIEEGYTDVIPFDDCTKLETIEFGGTKAEWCEIYGISPTNCYSYMLIGKGTELYKELAIEIECSDGKIIYANGDAQ